MSVETATRSAAPPMGDRRPPADIGTEEDMGRHTAPAGDSELISGRRLDRPVVLVIDDDPVTRDLVGMLLECHGLSVITAADGAEGLSAVRTHPVAAVVLDVVMPDVDGHQVLRRLREGPLPSGIPVIMLTALNTLDSELESMLSGADAFLTKPVRRAELLAHLEELL